MKSSRSSLCSTRGRSPTIVLPSPTRKLANTTATTQRPRRNHFSDRRKDLLIEFLLGCGFRFRTSRFWSKASAPRARLVGQAEVQIAQTVLGQVLSGTRQHHDPCPASVGLLRRPFRELHAFHDRRR